MSWTVADIARMIDHSLLTPTLSRNELDAGCYLAVELGVASVCTMPFHQQRCAEILSGSGVRASTTIGFPHGAHTSSVKRVEAEQAVKDGCEELDMVVNVSQVCSGAWEYVKAEIADIAAIAHGSGRQIKVIFENCYLNQEEKLTLCKICTELKADWVKTSTGYGSGGATLEDVRLMQANTPSHVEVKAAGGVRDLDTLLAMREAGATRIGASRTAELLEACRQRLDSQA